MGGSPATLRRIIPAVPGLLREFPPARGAELAGAGGRPTGVLNRRPKAHARAVACEAHVGMPSSR
jgi:hypothetical protein